ncbi:pilin [Patescibacteria group bacterium]|nr:pilin [Patescibacteria group bacterium]
MKKLSLITIWLSIWLASLLPQTSLAQTALQNPLDPVGGGYVAVNQIFARAAYGLVFITGTLALIIVILGGYRILTAAGNSENFAKGKNMVVYAILGFILTIASYTILDTVIKLLSGGQITFTTGQTTLFDPLGMTGKSPVEFYGQRILRYLLSGLGALTLLMGIYGGATWMLAAGNEEKITKAKKTLGYAVLGLIIVLGSYTVISFAYAPFAKLLQSGQPPAANLETLPPDAIAKEVACFREPINKKYGATCTIEKTKDCLKATTDFKAGKSYGQEIDCSNIGACVQILPGNFNKNRILASECQKEIFKPLSTTNQDGSCPFGNTLAGEGDKSASCYADVMYLPGEDYPPASLGGSENEEWACLRTESNYIDGPRQSTCSLETAVNCKQVRDNYLSGQWYQNLNCVDVGYCQQNLAGHQQCRNGLTNFMCEPKIFPPVASPVIPWGCSFIGGSYDEIDGACYLPKEYLKFQAGKLCP